MKNKNALIESVIKGLFGVGLLFGSLEVAQADIFWRNLSKKNDEKIMQISKKRIEAEAKKNKAAPFFLNAIEELTVLVKTKKIFGKVLLEVVKSVDTKVLLADDNLLSSVSINLRTVGSYKTLKQILLEVSNRLRETPQSGAYLAALNSLALTDYHLHEYEGARSTYRQWIAVMKNQGTDEQKYFSKLRYAEFLIGLGEVSEAQKVLAELKNYKEASKEHQRLWLKVLEVRVLYLLNQPGSAKNALEHLSEVFKKMEQESLVDYEAYVYLDAAYYSRNIGNLSATESYLKKANKFFSEMNVKPLAMQFLFGLNRLKNKIYNKDKVSAETELLQLKNLYEDTEMNNLYKPICEFYSRLLSGKSIVDPKLRDVAEKLFGKGTLDYQDSLVIMEKYNSNL